MFHISEKLVSEQEEIHNCGQNSLEESHSWKQLSSIGDDEPLSIFNAPKSTSSQILCCVLERFIHIRNPTKLGRKGLKGSSLTKATETVKESTTEFEWNIFPGSPTLQLCGKVTDLLSRFGRSTRNFHRKNSICVNVQLHLL